ncbi:MAG: BatD family protein, partial [Muribaculaceae bacterium]|nr:BatD family protein [Muribaculaceae bacterium]
MTTKIRHLVLILLGVIAFGCSLNLSAQKVELSLQSGSGRGPIEIGEQFYVYVTLKNIDAEPVPIRNAGGAEVVYWTLRSSRSSVTSINGRMSQSVEKVYAATLIARKKGNYTIDPITVGGYKSNALKYSIVDAGSNPDSRRQAQSQPAVSGSSNDDSGMDSSQGGESGAPTFIGKGNEQLFLRANVSKTTVYEQEALVYTVKLYTTYSSIKFIGATEAPKFDGFVIEESNAISNQLTFETYQGKQYATAVIARYIIFPQMSGKLRIIGNKYTVSTDANEYYHDPMFMTLTVRRPIQLNVSPNDLEVNVKPLPTPRPANL